MPVTWPQLFPTNSPPPRYFTSMASDAADGYVLLFGGENTTHVMGDTWMFKAGVWTQLSPSTSPPPRYGASMVYDAADRYVLLFGGAANGIFLSDTWEFKGGSWTQLFPASAPSPRYFVSTTYDVADRYVILFGGENNGVFLSDTWKFTGGTWSQLATPTSPSARCCVSMTYDAADSYVLLFGGDTSTVFGDTWTFKAGVWTQLSPSSSPSIRAAAGMAYDPAQGYVLLFGGENVTSATAPRGDTWEFTSGIWIQLSPTRSPSPRDAFGLVYDSNDSYPLLFSGYNGTGVLGDTWKFGPITSVPTKATPTISSAVTPRSITIGGSASDLATVSGGSSPTGTVTYTVYRDSACATPVFTSTTIPLGTHSGVFTPSTAGTYFWVAKYNGDVNNNAVSTICGASGETLTVVPPPDFTLTPSSTTITVAANSIASDKLRVDATNGFAGTVSFLRVGSLSGLSYSCSSVTLSLTVVSANSTCTFSSTTPGTYTAIVNGTGGTPLVFHLVTYTVVVVKNTPPIHTALSASTITVGESVTDSATLTGTDLLTASGTVTYQFFSGFSCAGAATIVGTPVVVNGGVIPASVSKAFNSAGLYSWNAVYSGDASNNGATSQCEPLTVNKATPHVTSTVTPSAITVGSSATDLAAVSGFIPTGTTTYTAYSDSSCTTSVFTSASIPLGTSSGAFTPNAAGTYYWVASYGGDSNNNAVATTCGAVGETLTVNAVALDYSLSVNPVTASIIAGSSTSTTVTATLTRGEAQRVTLLLLISPNPAVCQVSSGPSPCGTISFSPTSITPSSNGATSTLTVSTTSLVPPGTYSLKITGSPAGSSHSSATFTLTINAPSVSTVSCGHDLSCSVLSNSTLTNVKFAGITIHAEADGPRGTHGYANITVPKTAIHNIDNLHVFVDNSKLARSDVTITSNSTDYFIYFTFTFHSPVQIDIQLTTPENTPSLILGFDPTLFYEIVGALVTVFAVIIAVTVMATRRRSRASNIPRQQ